EEIHWDFIRGVLASVANTAIVPLQDPLGLGTEARMNLPNSTEGNWAWRYESGALTDALAARLTKLTKLYGRTQPRITRMTRIKRMKTYLFVLICVICVNPRLTSVAAQAPEILKVDPPSWWVGSSLNPVRVLIRGRNLQGAQVQAGPGLRV